MTKKDHNQQVSEVGTFIPKAHFKSLQNNYKRNFPETSSSFIVNKGLIQRVLQSSSSVVGIRFMFGLEDELNPNSVRLFLVPCMSAIESPQRTVPILNDVGYFDHLGQRHSLHQVAEMIAQFVKNVLVRDSQQVYKQVTRGVFFGVDSLNQLINREDCYHILFHMGMRDKVIKPILEPIDNNLEANAKIYMDFGQACPPLCEDGGDGGCIAKFTFAAFEMEEDLSIIRHFRDNILLDLESGPKYYEMYYFISPFLRTMISTQDDKENALSDLYTSLLKPIKEMLYAHQYEAALGLLKSEMSLLVRDYELEWSI